MRITITDQNCTHEETKIRLNSGNACYCSVYNILSSCLLCNNLKIIIYKTIILPEILYGYETWSFPILMIYENGMLRRMLGPN